MNKNIEELSAQRELIQQHLDWIDRQIAEQAGTEQAERASIPAKAAAIALKTAKPTVAQSSQTPPTPASTILDDGPDIEKLVAPAQNDIQKAKIGCLAIFIIATSLFLFLLFGLPYLMD